MPRTRRTPVIDRTDDEDDDFPQDPEPADMRPAKVTSRGPGKIPARTSSGRVASKTSLVKAAEEELRAYLTLAVAGWSMADPDCADLFDKERIDLIVTRVVKILARDEKVLVYFTKAGIISDCVALLSALLPVAKAVWKAHGIGGHGHGTREIEDVDHYPAYTGPRTVAA